MNGLVKGFWKLVSRDDKTNATFTKGKDVRLTAAQKKKIADNVERMSPTSAFSAAFRNTLTCALFPGAPRPASTRTTVLQS